MGSLKFARSPCRDLPGYFDVRMPDLKMIRGIASLHTFYAYSIPRLLLLLKSDCTRDLVLHTRPVEKVKFPGRFPADGIMSRARATSLGASPGQLTSWQLETHITLGNSYRRKRKALWRMGTKD